MLRKETSALHLKAERTGFIAELLHKEGSQLGVAILFHNLLPVYQHMEAGLDCHRAVRGVRAIVRKEVYRAAALQTDIEKLTRTNDWPPLPLLASAQDYTDALDAAAEGDGISLIAHAYVRFLGDMSGGQILKRVLSQALQISGLSFYEYPEIDFLDVFKDEYRRAFDTAGAELSALEQLQTAEEAKHAFECNINLSLEIKKYLDTNGGAASVPDRYAAPRSR